MTVMRVMVMHHLMGAVMEVSLWRLNRCMVHAVMACAADRRECRHRERRNHCHARQKPTEYARSLHHQSLM